MASSHKLPNLVQRTLYAKDLDAFKEAARAQGGGAPMYSRGGNAGGQTPPLFRDRLSTLQDKVREITGYSSVDDALYAWQDKFIDLKPIQARIKALNGVVSETNDAYLPYRALLAQVHPSDFANHGHGEHSFFPVRLLWRTRAGWVEHPGSLLLRHQLRRWGSFRSASTPQAPILNGVLLKTELPAPDGKALEADLAWNSLICDNTNRSHF